MLAIASEKTFQSLIKVIGHPEWIADPRFTKYSDRRDHWADLMNGVEAWSHTLTTEKCLTELNGHGVPCSAYRTVAEALRDPQIAHRGALTEVRDGGGTFKVLNLPFRMSGATVSAAKRMSTLGEHTVALLKEAGLSQDEIAAALTATGASPAAQASLRLFTRQPPLALPGPAIPANITDSSPMIRITGRTDLGGG
jgi:crotonobetainyl-CoA:carnitine CoA-transferase CaiB-like acyl-CoA transferase